MDSEMRSCCYWNPELKHSCQFGEALKLIVIDDPFHEFDGKTYCPFHLPIEEKLKWGDSEITDFIKLFENISLNWGNFTGTHFPPFQQELNIASNSTSLNFSKSTFGDTVNFRSHTIIRFVNGNYHNFLSCNFGNTEMDPDFRTVL